jgi:hypothetical protein
MSEIEKQVETIMKEGKVSDLAKLSDEVFGRVICMIHADRLLLPGPVEVKPVEVKPARKVKHGK